MLYNTCPHCGKSFDGSSCPHCGEKRRDNVPAAPPTENSEPRGSSISAWGIIGGIILVALILMMVFPYFMYSNRRRPSGQFTSCQSNCKNIGTALEMYSTDNKGHYPPALKDVAPGYLQNIPTCQSAGRDTYSGTYAVSSSPDAYTFRCGGQNHRNVVSGDFPQYDSYNGLKAR